MTRLLTHLDRSRPRWTWSFEDPRLRSLQAKAGCRSRARRWVLLTLAVAFLGAPAFASPYGTSYTATVNNFPGTATATLSFDGFTTPVGSSGLLVGESSTSFVGFELLEFSLSTADGNPFVGQQITPAAVASVSVSDLFWFGNANPVVTLANTGFLWLTIDGTAQALSDVLNLGFVFGTHPLNASIPVLLIANSASTSFTFSTFGVAAFDAFAALVGPALALQIDDVHFGVAAAPVPEPGTGALVLGGLVGIAARRRTRRA